MRRDAAVDLDQRRQARFVDRAPQLCDLTQCAVHELLSAEARFDAHHEHQVERRQQVAQHFDRGGRLDRDAGPRPCGVDFVDAAVCGVGGFVVKRHDVGARFDEALDVAFGFDDHQVYVERFGRRLPDEFQDGESERDVGNEDAVHYVDMYPLGGTFVDHPRVAVEVAEIGRKHGGGDNALHSRIIGTKTVPSRVRKRLRDAARLRRSFVFAKIRISEGNVKFIWTLPSGSVCAAGRNGGLRTRRSRPARRGSAAVCRRFRVSS